MDKKFTQKDFSENQLKISDLFTGAVIGSASTTSSFSEDAESSKFLKVYQEQEDRFVPQIDFSTASNFAKFGSAVSYYEDAFTRIHNQYPYDGSQREKVLWNLSSSYLDKYVFENQYPRTTGYGTIGISQTPVNGSHTTYRSYNSTTKEYILLKGGPHADPLGDYKSDLESGKSLEGISKANVYNTASFRESNLKLDMSYGNTVEFWLKKDQWADYHSDLTGSIHGTIEAVFDVWNSGSFGDDNYGRLSVWLDSSDKGTINLIIASGSNQIIYNDVGAMDTGLTDIADGNWHHYAITLQDASNPVRNKGILYVDGVKTYEREAGGGTIGAATGSYIATIGSTVTQIRGDSGGGLGWAKLSGSIDEFRFWKTARTAKQIGRYYIDQVNGGTNTDLANTKLGVYYKFNEGITQTASVDSNVLDYSGRISNGVWTGYDSTSSRSTGSAIVESGKAEREFRDPIVYPFHPAVKSALTNLKIKGSTYDFNNSNSLINSIPAWIVENDAVEGTGELEKLIQILSNYLDTLYLQIEALPTIKNINYPSGSDKPHFFNRRLLKDYGFDTEEILTDVSLFSYANTRDEKKIFEKKIYDVKNQIYKNIYNNLVYIYKTKGTKKAFRNLLRCIGIDEELVRLNLYGKNTDWIAKTNTRNVSSKAKYVDFFNNISAVVYGYPETGNSNSNSYISGSGDTSSGIDKLAALTIEADVMFPKYPAYSGPYTKFYPSLTASIMGMDGVKYPLTPADTTWPASTINASSSLSLHAVRKQRQELSDNPEVFFILTGSMLASPLTSSVYSDVYDNSKWKFAVRLKNESQSTGLDFVSGSSTGKSTIAELVGIQMIADAVINQFNITGTLNSNIKYGPFVEPKRLYCGARRTNFTGSVIENSDAFVSNVRYWNSYLNDNVLLYHAKNDASYGTEHPLKNTYLMEGKSSTGLSSTEMPEIASLALNWNFDQVTGSDSDGRFAVSDFSSGSNSSDNYKLSNIVERQHTARGEYFTTSSAEVVERKYEPSVRLVPFDQINSDDMVEIVDFEGEIFTRDSRPEEYFFALEKSMYANVSDEMLNMFATIRDFHNLVGEPVNRYRKEYKEIGKLRELFFRRVGNTPDLEKFVEYYKWIDNSISTMFVNLVPATANFSKNIRTLVESHVLERNKIETKYPTLELNQPEPDGRIKAINELSYDWKHGHHPLNNEQDDNCLYWKDRAERDGSVVTSGDSTVDSQRESIKRFTNSVVSGSTYALRKFTRPYKFSVHRLEDFEIDNTKVNYAKTEINQSSDTDNIVFRNLELPKDCDDNRILKPKQRLGFQGKVNNVIHKGRNLAPFTVYTASTISGYKAQLSSLKPGLEINDNHRDVYGTETQEPLQGPFSKIHVGGKKSRKVAPLVATDRAEEYNLVINSSNITLNKRSADEPRSDFFLDEIAKRPVVIKNIKTTTGSTYHGNYSKEYQIVQTVGANTQRGWLKDNSTFSQLTAEVLNFTGNLNFNMMTRTGSSLQSVTIADRFSGPGSPEAMSPGYLDPASNTFSVYNSINYRNMTARLPRTNIQRTGAVGVTPASQYEFRPFGGNPNQSLRTLRTTAPLNTLLRNYMLPNGLDGRLTPMGSQTIVTGSVHKVNRNTKRKASSVMNSGVQVAIPDYLFDNGFIQHAIPQSDRQYSWITASLSRSFAGPNINSNYYFLGYGGGLTAPLGYSVKSNDMAFVGVSSLGIYAPGFYGTDITHYPATLAAWFIPNDFVGLNTNIYEPITASTNTLGYPNQFYGGGSVSADANYKGGLVHQIHGDPSEPPYRGVSAILNGLLTHRQGPYGWPTWKQIRGAAHPVMRSHRKTNTLSMLDKFNKQQPVSFSTIGGGGLKFKDNNILPADVRPVGDGIIANYTESVVTVNKPMTVKVSMRGVGPTGLPIDLPPDTITAPPQTFKFTYGNDTAYFAENKIFNSLTAYNYDEIYKASKSRSEAYKAITNLYLPTGTDAASLINPIQDFVSLNASQVVWPRTRNTFLNRTRKRDNYTEEAGTGSNGYDRIRHRTFWRNNIEDRLRTKSTALNTMGQALGQNEYAGIGTLKGTAGSAMDGGLPTLSVWPLDGRWTGSVSDLSAAVGSSPGRYGVYRPAGARLLEQPGQRTGSANAGPEPPVRPAGALYGGSMFRTVAAAATFKETNRFSTASCRYHGVDWNMGAYSGSSTFITLAGGLEPPIYPQRVSFTASSNINWTTNIDSGKNPWYDSYEEYSIDLNKIGKDYSIIPEFNISDHMPFYITQRNVDFLGPMPTDKFNIQGTNNSSSANAAFYDEYSHSDFLRNFDLVLNDHRGTAGVKTITMTCRGLKKLLPYNGFYPVTRTLQMATLLSQSIGSKIIGSGSGYDISGINLMPSLAEAQGLQSMIQPFFAPGILYNTIKSGIAVDWPLYTSSAPNYTAAGDNENTVLYSSYISSSANYRLPFEALYDLGKMPLNSKIYGLANSINDAHFAWNGEKNNNLYEMAMNNFLAESVNLFLRDGKLTSFVSKPMRDVQFKENTTYKMSIDIEKTTDFLMTEGASANSIIETDLFKSLPAATSSYAFHGTSHRGIIYGPSVRFFDIKTADYLSSSGWFYCEANDPANAPYTPPYFYGKATVNLTYKNTVDDTTSPTLSTIFNNMTASYINDLSLIPTGSTLTSSVTNLPWRSIISSSSPAIQSMMQISSSLNLFGKTNNLIESLTPDGTPVSYTDPEDPTSLERWVISTKYECPILNFNHYTDDTKARGMWNGYGNIPDYSSEGIRITLRETNPAELYGAQNLTSGSLLKVLFGDNNPSEATTQTKTVGQLPNDFEKSISECIVAIPFLPGKNGSNAIAQQYSCLYSSDDDKFFFPAPKPVTVTTTDQGPNGVGMQITQDVFGDSYNNLQEKMKKFVFPPRYDFVNNANPAIAPFVMFAFEFTHRFTRQELADIWQGVMPDISTKVIPETTTLSIPAQRGELMGEVFLNLSMDDRTDYQVSQLVKNLKWMVFKVKQRAKNVYANVTEDIRDNKVGTLSNKVAFSENELAYSYNWPYDYCSLVELAKFEVDMEIRK